MKYYITTAIASALVTTSSALVIPSDGSDGALNPPADVEIDLSQAVTGVWSDDNTANIGKGVYDPDRWVVVFKYSSVNIPEGVTVTFKNHPSNAPVMWLVQNDATIAGTVSLNGSPGLTGIDALSPPEAGPGGFRGGSAGPDGAGAGLGPGGGATPARAGLHRSTYGNPQIIPTIGGSGGSGESGDSGGGGGGSIFLGVTGTLTLDGTIQCNGGSRPATFGSDPGQGSGGSVRVVADTVLGSGSLEARDGLGNSSSGSAGRIRLEAVTASTTLKSFPETVAVPPASPPLIFPPANAPTVRIVSIDGIPAPADPRAPLNANADLAIQNNEPVVITVETTNFPIEGVVQLRVAQKFGNAVWLDCEFVSGTINQATWNVTRALTDGFSTLQARATAP